jgi:uncharacterized protein (TIGR02270 family)
VAACGARRSVRQHGLKAVLADREPMVRARAARTIGELGKADCRSELNAMLDDPEEGCRFWAAWSAARLGRTEGLRALTEFARSPGPRCERALDLLLRLLSTERANGFLRLLAREQGRRRTLIHAAAVVGDALYIPWLATQARDPSTARISGDAFAMITGADLAALGLALPLSADFQAGPSDDPDDENVAIDEDEGLAWPDSEKLDLWWEENKARFDNGTSYFLGLPKRSANWMGALSQAAQHQRWAAALELALRHPEHALFEVRARGNVQRRMINNVGAVT